MAQKSLIHKLEQNGISGKFLNLIIGFLLNRKQRLALNVKNSSWNNIETGVLQCLILGPLFYFDIH